MPREAVARRYSRERRAPASLAAAPPLRVTPSMRTTHGVRLTAGRRERLLVCHQFDSRCVAGTGRSCARTARAVGGSVAAERAGGRGEVLVESSTRWRFEGRALSCGGAWRRCMRCGGCGGGLPIAGVVRLLWPLPAGCSALVLASLRA